MIRDWWKRRGKIVRLGIILSAVVLFIYIIVILHEPFQNQFFLPSPEYAVVPAAMATLVQFFWNFIHGNQDRDTRQEPNAEHIDQLINELHDIDKNGIEAVHDHRKGYSSVWEDYDTATKTKFPDGIQVTLGSYVENLQRLNNLVEQEREIAGDFVSKLPGGKIYLRKPPQVITEVGKTSSDTPQPWGGPFRELLWQYKDIILTSDKPEELRTRLIQEAERSHFRTKNIFEWYDDSWLKTPPYYQWHEVIYHQKENSNLERYIDIIKEQNKCKSAVARHTEEALKSVKENYRK